MRHRLASALRIAALVGAVMVASSANGLPRETVVVSPGTSAGDLFGWDLDLEGDTLVVAARFNDAHGTDVGAAYVFARDGDTWTQETELVPDGSLTVFGNRIDVSSDTVVVLAGRPDVGVVALYGSDGAGPTLLDQETSPDNGLRRSFGVDVAIDGPWLVAGAFADNEAGVNTGSAFVYERVAAGPPGTWEKRQKLLPGEAMDGANFGFAVDIDGDTLVVGALRHPVGGFAQAGAVFVFEHDGTEWKPAGQLNNPQPDDGDLFGNSVAIDGDTIVVDARGDDDAGANAGAVYVFERTGGAWGPDPQQKITVPGAQPGDLLGVVDLHGDLAVVGARGRDTAAGPDVGSAYLYERGAGGWTFVDEIVATDGAAGDFYGGAKIDGDTVAVSGVSHDEVGVDSGAVFIYDVDTRPGADVTVQPVDATTGGQPVTLIFDMVTEVGTTTLTTSDAGPTPPEGFRLGEPPVYFDIVTTAEFLGAVTVCIDYGALGFEALESSLQLAHFEGGVWVDRTGSVDTEADVICGSVTSLSPFAVFEPDALTAIDMLIARIGVLADEGSIPRFAERSLSRLLLNAKRDLERGRTRVAALQIGVFLGEVRLLGRLRRISAAVERELVDAGRALLRQIDAD